MTAVLAVAMGAVMTNNARMRADGSRRVNAKTAHSSIPAFPIFFQ